MNVHASLLGAYHPQQGWLFRLGTGWKYLLLLALSLPPILVGRWWFTVAVALLALGMLWSSGIGPRRALRVGWMLWSILATMAVYQLITLQPELAVTTPGNVLIAVLASRMLTLTTSTPELLDALVRGLAGLRRLGVNVDQIALAIAVMVRSIPYLMGAFDDSRDAAQARGRDGNIVSLLIPTMVSAVAYAQSTAEALHARGLAERESR